MIDYFYYTLIEMQYNDDFILYSMDGPYKRYTDILKYYHNDSPLIESIVKYVMDVYKKDNIETCLMDSECIPVITVPREHIYYIILSVLSNPLQTVGFSFKVIEEGTDVKDNSLTKLLYMLMLKVLQAQIITYAVKEVIKDIRADDHTIDLLKDDIAKFIHTTIFNENDLGFERIIDYTYIPQLYGIYDSYVLHIFDRSHPVIINEKIHTDIDFSGCFIDKAVSELHSELLTIFNKLCPNGRHIVLTVSDEDDYDYIKLITDSTINISVDIIYHNAMDFKDACIEYFINESPNEFIKDIIYLHDNEYGLINDIYEFPPHPPDSFEEIPERIIPFLIDIAKTL